MRPIDMNIPLKLASFGVGLIAVFGAAAGLGAVVGPDPEPPAPATHGMAASAAAGHEESSAGHVPFEEAGA